MAAYFTRAKARSEVELEDTERGDSASAATTTPKSISSVGLQVGSMRELESVSTEVAGPVTTHPSYYQRETIPRWVGALFQGLLALSEWGLPWDTPVDVQTHLIAMELVLPMF